MSIMVQSDILKWGGEIFEETKDSGIKQLMLKNYIVDTAPKCAEYCPKRMAVLHF